MADRNLSTPMEDRLAKRADLLASGVDIYPTSVSPTVSLKQIRERWGARGFNLAPDSLTDEVETVAGRVMFKRGSGKIAFAALQEGDGTRLQVMLNAKDIGMAELDVDDLQWDLSDSTADEGITLGKNSIKRFEKTVDMGDFIEVTGPIATSIKGELSIRATSWRIISKGVRPLPFLHADLSEEMRVRQPYAHLIQSQEARDLVRSRSRIIRSVRRAFEDWDFIEIETPVLQPTHGGALARPFATHVNALDQDFSLRISLETNLKKAVVGGIERVFEIGKNFRNEGIDSSHSPEFTMLEAYAAYGDMYSMAELTERVFRRASEAANGTTELTLPAGDTIDFEQPFQWLSVYEGVSAAVGSTVTSDTTVDELLQIADSNGVALRDGLPAGKIVMELASELVEPTLVQPTFLHDWPAEAQPLARRNPEDDRRILAWDLIVGGMEVATAFTELIDPVVQREILTQQSLLAAAGDAEAMKLDEDFLRALSYGMPPTGGLGIGIDRLVMLLTGSNIREAILFPLIRREEF